MNTKLKHLQIGDLTARLPIIQGGMGVGVSLSKLAGAVAKEGGVGIISTAQIGYDEKGFEKDQAGCNRLAIRKHIQKAKEIACGNGLIGVIDEEGRIKDKKANIDYYGSDIRGTVVITAADGESFRSLTTSEIQSARTYLMKNSIGG